LFYFRQHIIPELQKPNVDQLPVLKAASIKYVMTFRSQLPGDMVKGCLPYIVKHLKAQSHVTHSYAAAAIGMYQYAQSARATTCSVITQPLATV
jgi:hypothetical protein